GELLKSFGPADGGVLLIAVCAYMIDQMHVGKFSYCQSVHLVSSPSRRAPFVAKPESLKVRTINIVGRRSVCPCFCDKRARACDQSAHVSDKVRPESAHAHSLKSFAQSFLQILAVIARE